MIAKVVRGWRPAGLIAYLFGPGRFEEHRNPRVIASWDGHPWAHHPDPLPPVVLDGEVVESGEFDLDLKPLMRTMQETAEAAGLPTTTPPPITPEWAAYLERDVRLPWGVPDWVRHYRYHPGKQAVVLRQGYVWHCSVRLHPDDPTLTDEQWETVAERLMRATGITQAGCRWIAVRHADDHIHLMATLVSETTGRPFHPYRDYPKLRAECQAVERDLDLVRTAGIDKAARPAPTRAEKGKAQRHGRTVTAREELQRVVAQCAAATSTPEAFLHAVRWEGLNPQTVLDDQGRIRGYSVALPGDLTAEGRPVRYSGRSLAPDLTWPALLTRWAATPATPARTDDARPSRQQRLDTLTETTTSVQQALRHVRTGGGDVDAIAHAVGEVLGTYSRVLEGRDGGPVTAVVDRYDRATRTPHHILPTTTGSLARELRAAARCIAAVGALSGRGQEKFAGTALLLAVAALVAEIAAWQQQQGRVHQAAAASTASGWLVTHTGGGTSRQPSVPSSAVSSRPQVFTRRPGPDLPGPRRGR